MIRWTVILIYWIWLEYRNISGYRSNKDWKLLVQIIINLIVILVIAFEL